MEISVNNIREALFALIALAGEIPCDIKIYGVTPATIRNGISACKTSKLINYDKKQNRIRLRAPKGLDYLKDLSEDLYKHYMMVSNNHKFRSEPKNVEAQKLFSHTVLLMIGCGYEIDNLRIRYESNNFGMNDESDVLDSVLGGGILDLGESVFTRNGKIIPIEESVKHISGRRFYTSKYIKRGFPVTHRINFSNSTGLMISSGNVYRVYTPGEDIKLKTQSEKDMNVWLRQILRSAGETCEEIPAIIICDDTEAILKKDRKLTNMFPGYRVVPRDGVRVLDILSSENWEEKLQTALYGAPSEMECDGEFDRVPSWELLSCDYGKIRKALQHRMETHLICFKWQEEIVKKKTKNTATRISILSEDQEEILINYIKE